MNRLCACGCGLTTKISDRTETKRGVVKGEHLHFINGHNGIRHGATAGRRAGGQATPEYNAYQAAQSRCTNPNHPEYPRYGARGIRFLFNTFEQFIEEIGMRPSPKHSLDRINNDGSYAPGNVRWATPFQQTHNRRCSA